MRRKPLPELAREETKPHEVVMAEIARRLDVTLMTINTWRKGSTARLSLPVTVEKHGEANRVFIREDALIRWLAAYRPDLRVRWMETKNNSH